MSLTRRSESFRSRSPIAWSAIDLALCLILVIFTLIAPPKQRHHHRPAIETLGVYAITATWPRGSNDDVDLYVQDPQQNVVSFSNTSAGQMQLEHDDRGCVSGSAYGTSSHCTNYERVVLRTTLTGEYIVDVHMYAKNDKGATPVVVSLYRLAGNDKALKVARVVLPSCGSEVTAFRFTLNANGYVTSYNSLAYRMVGTFNGCGRPPGAPYR